MPSMKTLEDIQKEAREVFGRILEAEILANWDKGRMVILSEFDSLLARAYEAGGEKQHDCESWHDEGRGCALCATATIPFEEFKERIEYHSWLVSDLQRQLAAQKETKDPQ